MSKFGSVSLLLCKMHVVNVLSVRGCCRTLQLHTPRKYIFTLCVGEQICIFREAKG
jgi:hypothetical protein